MSEATLAGRVAIVTGGHGGIGRAIVARLLRDGAHVAVFDLSGNEQASRDSVLRIHCDVTVQANVETALASVREALGPVQILVNNAGLLGPVARVLEITTETWRRVTDVNLTGTFVCCKAVASDMVQAGYGRIINIASVQGKEGMELAGAYAASKAGVIALTKTLGKELATSGVLVNCITPTAVDGGMIDEIEDQRRAYILDRIPMNRFCSVDEVAAMVAWLASDECSFSTGGVFDLSGGRSSY
ncbi:SDR family oxidoreductase (plasmid) [Mesorhizobium sp. AR07]|uniref:SDR family NAD(P)-dependent oxidoreductase n=1 Tax=Mesorhizobium sp. AR07 TaxID=2865838 RepID=UPI00215F9999|nr:SDR family NAD(P)-dependent oxidoreductase [Mesorhizobium sp. AR07]UVK48636.1 SDR family oxidoreductase [Mesorhizobium sp. AR07]